MNPEQNDSSPQLTPNRAGKNIYKFILPAVIIAILAVAGVMYTFLINTNKTDQAVNNTNQQVHATRWNFGLVQPVFAQSGQENVMVKPAVPFAKVSVAQIENIGSFTADSNVVLSDDQKAALEDSGFFLASNDLVGEEPIRDDFVDMYDQFDGSSNQYYRQGDDAVFITSDLALHLYHILIDRSFQSIEETKFQPMLRAMTKSLFADSLEKYNTATAPALKDSYKRLAVYYLIPLVALDAGSVSAQVDVDPKDFDTFAQYLDAVKAKKIENSAADLTFSLADKIYDGQVLSDEIYDLASAELALIQKAEGKAPSPLFTPLRVEFENDYSQFKPRSHYTKNDVLKSYFVAMMWYGRMGFPLNSPALTRDALLITAQINNLKVNDQDLSKLWSDMATVIDFFVGEVDDLTAYHYTGVINDVYGAEVTSESFADEQQLDNFIAKAKKDLPTPKIVSELLWVFDNGGQRDELLASTKQFRFMGQRFTPDAYIINNLTQGEGLPEPETGQMLPSMPTALMSMHLLAPDNEVVKAYLDQWINDPVRIKQQGRQSDKVIAKVLGSLKAEFAGYDAVIWSKNIYWRWLDAFKALLKKYGEGYPSFMQTDAWQKKNLGTALGSFTELKHDTLLYAKQSYAELGGGPGENPQLPPVVKGYVEPDLEFWNKIIDLAEITKTGLESRGVFPGDYETKYELFIDTSKFFRQLAEQELKNEKISDEDFEKLRTISFTLGRIVEPIPGQELTKREKRAGIIADIHTDGIKGQILYEATGKPYIAYIAVKDANGTRLTRGVVFNHYEFSDKFGERLSDEDWQATVYEDNGVLPAADAWSTQLIK
ncbi:MAG: DUF3160 domain-containing protein [Candidatus Buchananbacteria bacterium]|nr:DUF3160 domain-containing protein [Candidatus Buchananbacteria bacterium]